MGGGGGAALKLGLFIEFCSDLNFAKLETKQVVRFLTLKMRFWQISNFKLAVLNTKQFSLESKTKLEAEHVFKLKID